MMSATPSQRLGLITCDPRLIDSVSTLVSRSRHALEIASEPELARAMLSGASGFAAHIVDHASRLLATGCLDVLGVPMNGDELTLVVPRGNHPSTQVHVYSRADVEAMLLALDHILPYRDSLANLIIGDTPAIRLVREQIHHVAPYRDVAVLVLGETGTGKELVAQAIHEKSGNRGAFVATNCAAIPETLFESELFGHEAGAYTGARGVRVGLLESAGNGTIFLDEIGEMPLSLQPKLLRVLETRRFRRVGSNRDIPLEARIVSATNRGLRGFSHNAIRPDLLYRLAGFTITIPALRDRAADVDGLADEFLASFTRRHRRSQLRFSDEAMVVLRSYPWPGNVRELKVLVEQVAILAKTPVIERDDVHLALSRLPRHRQSSIPPVGLRTTPPLRLTEPVDSGNPSPPSTNTPSGVRNLRALERELIEQAFDSAGGNLTLAAAQLGIPRSTLRDKLKKLGLAAKARGRFSPMS